MDRRSCESGIQDGSTVLTSLDFNIDVVAEMVFGSPYLALNRYWALVFLKVAALLCRPILVLFDERGKSDSSVIGDFNVRRGASDAHRRHRGINLHLTNLRHFASNEGKCSLGQTE